MSRDLLSFASPASVAGWAAIDDRVMGGISSSRMRHDAAGHAVFEGTVSLESGGGFASVRSGILALDAGGATTLLLEVRGDGRRYKLGLRTDDAFDGVASQAAFEPPAGRWTVVRLPVAEFRPTFHGRPVPGTPALDPAGIRQVGFVIADRQAGRFALAVRRLQAE
jgi:hypothetical protein